MRAACSTPWGGSTPYQPAACSAYIPPAPTGQWSSWKIQSSVLRCALTGLPRIAPSSQHTGIDVRGERGGNDATALPEKCRGLFSLVRLPPLASRPPRSRLLLAIRPNTSQCRRRFSYWPPEASFTLRARTGLSSSTTRDPASSTQAPPKTAFDAELFSQAKSLCAARVRSWMQDSDTPVCPAGLLVERSHPWPRPDGGREQICSSVIFPPSPAATHSSRIRQDEPPHVSSPLGVEESTASGALQAGFLRLRSSNFSTTGMSGNPIGILDWLAEGPGVPVNLLDRSQDSAIRTPWGVCSAGPLSWPFCAPRRPARKHRTPSSMGERCRLLVRGESKRSNGHALFREVNTDSMYREANHSLASAPVEVPCTPCTFFPFFGRTSPGLVLRCSSRLAPAYPRWLRLPAPHNKTARSPSSPFAHKGRLDSRESSWCPDKCLPAARS